MPTAFDPSACAALDGLADRLPSLAGTAYAAGQAIHRKGSVAEPAVSPAAASAAIQGSGASPYRVSIGIATPTPKPGCTCPAHRRNPWCKHVVALVLELLTRPERFAQVAAPPEAERAPKVPRRGKAATVDPATLRATGLETLDRLIESLADGGLMAMGAEKRALLRTAADLVRALKLRRLATLLETLRREAEAATLDDARFVQLLVDLALIRRTTGAHLDGRISLDGGLAEELVGRTWQASDLETVRDLELVQLAYVRSADGDFRLETSYLLDLPSGSLYLERQITPAALRRAPAKPSYASRLQVTEAGLYPGTAPRRIKLVNWKPVVLRRADIERTLAAAECSITRLRAALVAHRASPFVSPALPVVFRPQSLVSSGKASGALDSHGCFLSLTWSRPDLQPALARLLPPQAPVALCGALDTTDGHLSLKVYGLISAHLAGHGPTYPGPEDQAGPW